MASGGKKHQSVFDKLTDHTLYTGAHKSRFDTHGNGTGINQTTDDNPRPDMSTMMRPGFHSGRPVERSSSAKTLTHSKSGTSSKSGKSSGSKGKSKDNIFDRLNDPSSYTGAHKARFDKNGNGLGINQTTDDNPRPGMENFLRSDLRNSRSDPRLAAQTAGASSRSSVKSVTSSKSQKSAKSSSSKGSGIFDRLTDPSTYHGTHKHRFDSTGNGRGAAGRR